ncbi:response regulator transcription factor [Blautia glucerasea]|uniref:response regulator transcription factor n=1 Tax=Blautia glucerasea TaxID=536633 RepID=UPI0015711381|nr:response regulator [Blautia glucerasea]NSJ26448.1 response regulator [Blautia glucerasea]
MKIILADDEGFVRLGIKAMLQQLCPDAEIREASNGEEILKIGSGFHPDYVLADIKMPKMSGLEALKQWKEGTDTLWIILSGYSDFEYARKCIQYGVTDYLLKPVSFQELEKVMERGQQIRRQLQEEKIEKIRNDFIHFYNERDSVEELKIGGRSFLGTVVLVDQNLKGKSNSDDEIIEQRFLKICAQSLRSERITFWIKRDWNEYMVISICSTDSETEHLQKKIDFELDALQGDLKEKWLTVYRTDICSDADDLVKQLSQIENLKYLRCMYGTGKCVHMCTLKKQLIEGKAKALQLVEYVDHFVNAYIHQDFVQCIRIIHNTEGLLEKNEKNMEELEKIKLFSEKVFGAETGHTLIEAMNRIMESGEGLQKELKGNQLIAKIKKYIDENYHEQINVQWLAEKFHITPNYLSNLFKKETSLNLVKYVNELRMKEAEYLIRNTTLSIKAVCERVGFSSTRYFTKLFIETYGCYPSDIRRK